VVSNQRLFGQRKHKDQDTMIQLIEDMEIGEQESIHNTIGVEEATSHHTFNWLLFYKVTNILGIFYRLYCSIKNWKMLSIYIYIYISVCV
jgi:hypothetical protein